MIVLNIIIIRFTEAVLSWALHSPDGSTYQSNCRRKETMYLEDVLFMLSSGDGLAPLARVRC